MPWRNCQIIPYVFRVYRQSGRQNSFGCAKSSKEWRRKPQCVNVTPKLIQKLDAINRQLIAAIGRRDILDCLAQNQSFHFTLYQAANSATLMPLIKSLGNSAMLLHVFFDFVVLLSNSMSGMSVAELAAW